MVLRTDRGKYSSQELSIFSNLETHIEEIQSIQAQTDRITLTAKAVKDYSKTDMTEEAIAGYAARVGAFQCPTLYLWYPFFDSLSLSWTSIHLILLQLFMTASAYTCIRTPR